MTMNDHEIELKKGKTGAQAMLNHILIHCTVDKKSLTFKEIDELGKKYIEKIWR